MAVDTSFNKVSLLLQGGSTTNVGPANNDNYETFSLTVTPTGVTSATDHVVLLSTSSIQAADLTKAVGVQYGGGNVALDTTSMEMVIEHTWAPNANLFKTATLQVRGHLEIANRYELFVPSPYGSYTAKLTEFDLPATGKVLVRVMTGGVDRVQIQPESGAVVTINHNQYSTFSYPVLVGNAGASTDLAPPTSVVTVSNAVDITGSSGVSTPAILQIFSPLFSGRPAGQTPSSGSATLSVAGVVTSLANVAGLTGVGIASALANQAAALLNAGTAWSASTRLGANNTTEMILTPLTSSVSGGTSASITGSAQFDAVPGYSAGTVSLNSSSGLQQYPVYAVPPAVAQKQSAYITVLDPSRALKLNLVLDPTTTVAFNLQNNVQSGINAAVAELTARGFVSVSSSQISSTQWRIQFTFPYANSVSGVGFTVTEALSSQSAITKLYGLRVTSFTDRTDTTFPTLPWPVSSIPPTTGGGGGSTSTVWDDAFNASDTITNSGRTASFASYAGGHVRTVHGKTSGLWYFEVDLNDPGSAGIRYGMAGVIDSTALHTEALASPGFVAPQISWYAQNGTLYVGDTVVDTVTFFGSRTVGVELNAGTRQVRFHTDTGPSSWYTLGGTGTIFGAFSSGASAESIGTINAGQAAFEHGLPSGATPLGDAPPPSADVTGAGYNDLDDFTGFGAGNEQATAPDSFGISLVDLEDFTVLTVAYVDTADITGTSSQTLAAFTNVGSGVAATPTNITGDPTGQLDDFTCSADGVADVPLEFTADYTLEDATSVAVGLFLAPIEGESDQTLEDFVTTDSAVDIVTPPTAQMVATLPALRVTATGKPAQFDGALITLPLMTGTARSGHQAVNTLPALVGTATGTTVAMARAIMTLPMLSVEATGRVSGQSSVQRSLPALMGAAFGGAQAEFSLPFMSGSGEITSGAVARVTGILPSLSLLASGYREDTARVRVMLPMIVSTPSATARITLPALTGAAHAQQVLTDTYEAYVMNMNLPLDDSPRNNFEAKVEQVTRYTNWPFVQVVRLNDTYYGVAADGLYELGGTTDNGAEIQWAFETCKTDFKDAHKKAVASAYIGGQAGPEVTYTLRSGDDADRLYDYVTTKTIQKRNHRQKFGLGRRVRYYSFGLAGEGKLAIDMLEFELLNTTRRI